MESEKIITTCWKELTKVSQSIEENPDICLKAQGGVDALAWVLFGGNKVKSEESIRKNIIMNQKILSESKNKKDKIYTQGGIDALKFVLGG